MWVSCLGEFTKRLLASSSPSICPCSRVSEWLPVDGFSQAPTVSTSTKICRRIRIVVQGRTEITLYTRLLVWCVAVSGCHTWDSVPVGYELRSKKYLTAETAVGCDKNETFLFWYLDVYEISITSFKISTFSRYRLFCFVNLLLRYMKNR